MTDAKTSVAQGFLEAACILVDTCVGVWPDEPLLPAAKAIIEASDSLAALDSFKVNFGAYRDRANAKDDEAIMEASRHRLLEPLHLETRWPATTQEQREFIWAALANVYRISTMHEVYQKLPDSILNVISNTASSLKAQLETGSLQPTSINPFELGAQVVSQIKPADIQAMMASLAGNEDAIGSLLSNMSGLMPAAMGPARH